MFPKRKNIWLPLLKVLHDAGRPLSPSEATQVLESYYPELTNEDKSYRTKKGALRWSERDVPWARYDLVQKGYMENIPRKWAISSRGEAYLLEHWPSWKAEYVNSRSKPRDIKEDNREFPLQAPGGIPHELDEYASRFWWVNQGETYLQERNLGIIWAPNHDSQGHNRRHWIAVQEIRRGDIIVHYYQGAIKALGIVQQDAKPRLNPHHDDNEWNEEGWGTEVTYYEFSRPILRHAIPYDIIELAGNEGPFDKNGQIKVGYCWPLSSQAFEALTMLPDFEWPEKFPIPISFIELTARESKNNYRREREDFNLVVAYKSIRNIGYQIGLEEFLNVLLSLAVRPFVVFSGRSGSGKTSLTRILADLFGWSYYRTAVSPAWAEPSDLFGFVSPITHDRIPGALEPLLHDAGTNVLLCMDEFNIAKVEHYFADFISAMDQKVDGWGILPSLERVRSADTTIGMPEKLRIIATMNFDDSVQSLTPRVLDRTNVIEFDIFDGSSLVVEPKGYSEDVSLDHTFNWPWPISIKMDDESLKEEIRRIWDALIGSRAQFGHRVAQDIYRYVVWGLRFAEDLNLTLDQCREMLLDRQIVQRILTKFHGTASRRDITAMLQLIKSLTQLEDETSPDNFRDLLDAAKSQTHFPRTVAKVEAMIERYMEDGYASYW